MMRRFDCALCGRALPVGCRIDKRYCGQRCVELAYYDRHPDKREQKVAKLRGTRANVGVRVRRPDSPPELVERMEAAHASTRQELGAVRERLAQLEALLRSQGAPKKEQERTHGSLPDASAAHKVAELQAALQDEKNRTGTAEREQASREQQLGELKLQQ